MIANNERFICQYNKSSTYANFSKGLIIDELILKDEFIKVHLE